MTTQPKRSNFYSITPLGKQSEFVCLVEEYDDKVDLISDTGESLEIETELFRRMNPSFIKADTFTEAKQIWRKRKANDTTSFL